MDPREYQFVFLAFLAAWLILIAYVVSIVVRERKLRKELDRVRRMVESAEKTAPSRRGSADA